MRWCTPSWRRPASATGEGPALIALVCWLEQAAQPLSVRRWGGQLRSTPVPAGWHGQPTAACPVELIVRASGSQMMRLLPTLLPRAGNEADSQLRPEGGPTLGCVQHSVHADGA